MNDRTVPCALLLAAALACASPAPGPPSPTRTATLDRFAGTWSYDEAATAQAANLPGTRPRDHINQRASDISMEMMREQGAGGDAVTGTPAGLRQTMLMVGITPETLAFEPSQGTVAVAFDGEPPVQVPSDGGWVDATTPQGEVEVRLRWRGEAFAVERRIPGGGTIRDGWSTIESGHLLVTREIVWRRARPVGLIVYGRRP